MQEELKIEEQNQLTEQYIEYLKKEDKTAGKRKGYIKRDDKILIGNTLIGSYFSSEQQFVNIRKHQILSFNNVSLMA